ncbi:Hemin transport protein [Stenotrophomonas sp. 24(2023)]|uniref:Hemin transport protein n=1 Tax=Stenotrophomonas sp. 24(2023) TaxID=3068324 RepID=UPI0027E0922A|nr:Hemin transport protein [Stenotrophomonas sp. 24(2023)]WMJ67869.1 Hemin transport protein [Stenotrophomonas sp. 24(2023)]
MSRALSARRHPPTAAPAGVAWPTPSQLSALGTVLCLYRADGSELAGWRQAVRVHACQGVDSEGLRESLCFLDARGRCVWRLYLLPDSDFLAWDRLVATLPPGPEHAADASSVGERLWRRLAGHLGGQRWRLCALRLHAADGGDTLAASLSTLSSLGAATAQRIARLEGADGELPVDDCCCAGAARRPAPRAPGDLPLVHL